MRHVDSQRWFNCTGGHSPAMLKFCADLSVSVMNFRIYLGDSVFAIFRLRQYKRVNERPQVWSSLGDVAREQ
ncbi:MAG: hypothetical protein RIS36_1259 [Pseudomonadota bacterium]|jgi:hypothetical protein